VLLVSFYLGKGHYSTKVQIDYLPLIPKILLIWGLNHLTSGDEVQQALKRRLVRLASNSIVPVNLLSKINDSSLEINQFQQATLPLSSWRDHIESVLSNHITQDALRCACLNLNQEVSEATLRVRVWDALIKSFVSDVNLLESEYHLQKILNCSNAVKVDLALVIRNFKIPALVFEIGKEKPDGSFEHKDFIKLGTVLGLSCLKLAKDIKCRGQDPLEARTFGSLVGYTSFKFIVASPEIFFNEKYNQEELFINLSFHDHWGMDLITTTAGTDCSSDCCSSSSYGIIMPTSQMNLQDSVLNENVLVSIDEAIEEHDVDRDVEAAVQTHNQNHVQEREFTYNMEAVCKLKIFINCANQAAAHFESLLNLPVLPPDAEGVNSIQFPSAKALIVKSLDKSSSKTPNEKRVRFEKDNQANDFGIGNSIDLTVGTLQKPASREIDVYRAIPTHYKIFFPLIHKFHVDPEDPKIHIFKIEILKPIWERDRLGAMIRTGNLRKLILEASTFAVHILFDLLILHEKAGYVHSDVSPSNIMFSERLNIWKLMDFDLSLPVEESWNTSRRAGTRDYKAPESIRTGIWTQASDVFALGKVIKNFFCDEMKRYEADEIDLPAFTRFNELINKMCSNDPNQRSTVRASLKGFIDFVFKYEVKSLQIYGYHLIFPLALEELRSTPPPISPAYSDSDCIPLTRISIKNEDYC
jgi:hypothetical protein